MVRYSAGMPSAKFILGKTLEKALIGDGNVAQRCAFFFGEHLPRHDVGVMFHLGANDLVAFLEVSAPPRIRDEVDGFGGIARPDDLARGFGADEPHHFFAGGFVQVGRFFAERIDAAMNIGVAAPVILVHRVNHLARSLRRGGAVEENERLAVNLAFENWKIGANSAHVKRGRCVN